MDEIPLSILSIILVLLLLASAFFSSSETALMTFNRFKLKNLAQKGDKGAIRVLDLLSKTDRLLSAILLGNNFVNSAAATVTTIFTFKLFGQNDLALTIGTLAITFAILIFSEITPKIIGATYPEKIAIPASYILSFLIKISSPLIWFVNLFVKGLLKLLRINISSSSDNSKLNAEELRSIVSDSGHFMPKKHQTMMLNLLELEHMSIDDVMVPRHQIEAIDIQDDEDEIIKALSKTYHTRIPVYDGELENIVGIVHVKKAFNLIQSGNFSKNKLRDIIREPYFVPTETSLFQQLLFFQENKRRIGVVVDEYGQILGLISLDDILEEVVGEFTTALDHSSNSNNQFDKDGSIVVEGSCVLRHLNKKLGFDFDLEGPKTLNGLILETFQDIPENGTTIKISNYPIEILQTQDRAVKVVRIHPKIK